MAKNSALNFVHHLTALALLTGPKVQNMQENILTGHVRPSMPTSRSQRAGVIEQE